MALTTSQKQLISRLDEEAKEILRQGDEEALLMSLIHKMDKIKDLFDSCSEKELDMYCYHYSGFYQYMHLLEKMAFACSHGVFDDIINQ